jgi:hypothetical protein
MARRVQGGGVRASTHAPCHPRVSRSSAKRSRPRQALACSWFRYERSAGRHAYRACGCVAHCLLAARPPHAASSAPSLLGAGFHTPPTRGLSRTGAQSATRQISPAGGAWKPSRGKALRPPAMPRPFGKSTLRGRENNSKRTTAAAKTSRAPRGKETSGSADTS